MSNFDSGSAQLEREVEAQRRKVESSIGEIRERLSPGQLVDELLGMTKDGGQHFAANLGQTVSNNPLPATLLGVSLIWLMSGQGGRSPQVNPAPVGRDDYYPFATVRGGLRRASHARDEKGDWFTTFTDESGQTYRAPSNEHGQRAGHFLDEAGRRFGGFIDEAGHRVGDFRDEAGNRIDDAAGWAAGAWSDVQKSVSDTADQLSQHARHLGGNVQHQTERATRMLIDNFQNQPLVAGAIAFAAGAALGAALPHTAQEDAALGKIGDDVRGKAAEVAGGLYEDGKAAAAELYEKGKESLGQVYDDAVAPLNSETEASAGTGPASRNGMQGDMR